MLQAIYNYILGCIVLRARDAGNKENAKDLG
jgi:hypothetical protein